MAALSSLHASAAGGAVPPEHVEIVSVVRQLLSECLAPPNPCPQPSGREAPGAEHPLPSADDFVRGYFDPLRYEGLPLRQ